jgi:hypothetical protein
MNRVVSLVCLTVLAAVAVIAVPRVARAAPKPTVAILGLELKDDGTGIDERSANIARLLTEALRKRAKVPNGPYNLSPGSDKELVDAMLLGGCNSSAETDCMVKIGTDMAADFLIFGKLEKQGKGGFQVSLTLLDIGKKQIVRRLPDIIPSSDTGDIALERWGKSLYSRLAGVSNKGSVLVTANVQSGQVFIEGQPKANLVKGSARITGLDEGKVKLRVESEGSISEQVITINGGETTEVDVKLAGKTGDTGTGGTGTGGTGDTGLGTGGTGDTGGINISREGTVGQSRPGGVWRKVFVGAAALTGVAGAAWGVSYYMYSSKYTDHVANSDECGNPAALDDMTNNPDLRSACKWRDRTEIAVGVTIGAAVIAGAAFYLGYIRPPDIDEAPPPSGPTARRHKKKRNPVSFTPIITGDGGGATVRIDW